VPGVSCPSCFKPIPPEDVNVKEGVAYCRACGELSRLADIADDADTPSPEKVLAEPPPPGCRFEDDGVTMRVVASARSLAGAIGALFFAGFWNSIVSIFVILVATSLWVRLVGPLPSWFPTPFTGSGNSAPMPLGMAIFMVIFLTPFVAIGLVMTGVALVCLFGHVSVSVRGAEGVAFTGVGPIGWRRRFDALGVRGVRIAETRQRETTSKNLLIEANRTIKIGSLLTERRRAWMAGVLKAVLLPGAGARGHGTVLPRQPIPPVAGPPLPEAGS
jgi:hypothetical protein